MKWPIIILVLTGLLSIQTQLHSKDKKAYAMSLQVFKEMESANLLVEEGQFEEALEDLSQLLKKRASKYEKAQIHSLMGSIHYRNSNQDSALVSFTKVLDSVGSMPINLHKQTLKTLSQLSMVNENYAKSKEYCEQLVAITEVPEQLDYALLAQANYKMEDWKGAVDAALKGRKAAYEQQQEPDENLLLLLNAVYFEINVLNKMPEVLEEIIKYYPKSSYILYLASVYGQLDRLDKQMVLMEALYEDGKLIQASQISNLASLYMSQKTPYKAAKVLKDALGSGKLDATERNFEMLSQAWQLAGERNNALDALAYAAELSDMGENYLRKSYLHFSLAQYKEAEKSLLLGFDKGLTDKHNGEAWLLLGMTRFNIKKFDSAIEACEKAKDYKKSAKHASQWIDYIATEKRKYESMQAVIM